MATRVVTPTFPKLQRQCVDSTDHIHNIWCSSLRNTLNRATGNRLKRKMVDAVTEEEVPTEEQVKGYAIGKDTYVQVEDDELFEIAIESSHTVDIEKFVPKASIDGRYRDTPYYLAPE